MVLVKLRLVLILLAMSAMGSYANLLFYYNFDDDTMTNEGSGTATLNNTPGESSYIDSKAGWGRAFNSAVNRPWASPNISGGLTMAQMTVSVMMRGTDLASWDDIWSIYDGSKHMYLETNSSNSFSLFSSQAYGDATIASSYNVEDGDWHWLTVTVDSAAAAGDGESKLYIDGVLRDTQKWSWTSGAVTQFQLGSRLFDGARAMTVDIDEFRIYDRALHQPEVANLMVIPEPATMGIFLIFGTAVFALRRRLIRR
jgi:hypothetical protein